MYAFAKRFSRLLQTRRVPAARITPPILSVTDPVEEQRTPRYVPGTFYPVAVRDVLDEKYEIVAKLGYGTNSTVWLAREVVRWQWQNYQYFVLKLLTAHSANGNAPDSELQTSRHIANKAAGHRGLRYLRTVEKSFEVAGPKGRHLGLLYEPMRETIAEFQTRLADERVPNYLLKAMLHIILTGLDCLHTKCKLIHTDLKPDNILVGIESPALLDELAEAEESDPAPRKAEGDHFIYLSRNLGDFRGTPGRPKISDFGLAVSGDVPTPHNHPIQANLFRAPEVILQAGWTYSTDIWNLGVMIWDCLEDKTLFDAVGRETGMYSPQIHLQEMVNFLGTPPLELLGRGKATSEYFKPTGELLHHEPGNERPASLEASVTAISGGDKEQFMNFVRRMLKWMPEERATAAELLQDPWLRSA